MAWHGGDKSELGAWRELQVRNGLLNRGLTIEQVEGLTPAEQWDRLMAEEMRSKGDVWWAQMEFGTRPA